MSGGPTVLVGTSGFKYSDWKPTFYPSDLPDREMLSYYSRHFPAVELDFTYYQMPSPLTVKGLERKTGTGFKFCVKAHKSMTHEMAGPDQTRDAFGKFVAAMRPLTEADKLGCILLQFPWKFKPSTESLAYLSYAREILTGLPAVVEFRNRDWVKDETFRFLKENDFGYCCVDEPRLRGLMPPVARYTASAAYVRFHGRNAAKWWHHEEPWERYDYLYSKDELLEWLPKIRALASEAGEVYVFFNNCHAGYAAKNALDMKEILRNGSAYHPPHQ